MVDGYGPGDPVPDRHNASDEALTGVELPLLLPLLVLLLLLLLALAFP